MVRILTSFILSLVFFCSGLVSASGFSSLERQIVVKVSHSHDHDHDDHSHSHESQNSQESKSSDDTHQSQHTHEIAVSFAHVLFVSAGLTISIQQFSENQFPAPFDTEAPYSCSLDSLFRKPIQA